jgi:regulatory protein
LNSEGFCYEQALRYLARREHSSKELKDKLLRKGFETSDIFKTLERLQTENFQSDQRFAEMLTRTRIAQRKGPRRIIPELQEHDIPHAMIQQTLAQAEVCWHTLAAELRCQRFGQEPPRDLEQKAKQYRFLNTRGFTSEQIQASFHL